MHGDRSAAPMSVAVIGCGAATRLYAAPALAMLERVGAARVTSLYDPDPAAVSAVRHQLPAAAAAPDFEAALAPAELAVIASPPAFHAQQASAAMIRGLHVFCEKPMALSRADADSMIGISRATGRLLTVGFVRRHLPAARAIHALMRGGGLGTLRSVNWFEGGPFAWPIASPRYFSFAESGGGVLQDIGAHALDLLAWWCGPPTLIGYADDAMGGVEANAKLTLRCGGAEVEMQLSRDWARPNRVLISGEAGGIGWTVNDPLDLDLTLAGAPPARLSIADGAADFIATYAAQLQDVVDAARAGRPAAVPAEAGRDACALVEACYAARTLLDMPWFGARERAAALHARAAS